MANRITIQSGYELPFDDFGKVRRKRRSSKRRSMSGSLKVQQNKMKSCAKAWNKSGKRGSYRAFMKKCL